MTVFCANLNIDHLTAVNGIWSEDSRDDSRCCVGDFERGSRLDIDPEVVHLDRDFLYSEFQASVLDSGRPDRIVNHLVSQETSVGERDDSKAEGREVDRHRNRVCVDILDHRLQMGDATFGEQRTLAEAKARQRRRGISFSRDDRWIEDSLEGLVLGDSDDIRDVLFCVG